MTGREAIQAIKQSIVKEKVFTIPYTVTNVSRKQADTLAAYRTWLTNHNWIPTGTLTGIEWHPPGTTTRESPITARFNLNWPGTHHLRQKKARARSR